MIPKDTSYMAKPQGLLKASRAQSLELVLPRQFHAAFLRMGLGFRVPASDGYLCRCTVNGHLASRQPQAPALVGGDENCTCEAKSPQSFAPIKRSEVPRGRNSVALKAFGLL